MATKEELLDQLEAAGVEGFSMDNLKPELEEAVAAIPAPPDKYPNRERYDNPRNRAHSVIGG